MPRVEMPKIKIKKFLHFRDDFGKHIEPITETCNKKLFEERNTTKCM